MEDVKIVVDADKKEEVTLVSPQLQKKVEEVTIVKPEEVKVQPVKMVKVKMKKDHNCYIGGEWYYLLKEKQYNVPENVKGILLQHDLLLPL